MLNNLRIGLRLGLGFSLVIVTLLAALAVAMVKADALNDELQVIVNRRFTNTVTANSIIDS
ncbi:MAG TPA: methyl-accepting chemotaxis protein, partial [Aquabacterium sp.]|nr:methyl-accepting chemotaxis protein [Aquabacterium sp.]